MYLRFETILKQVARAHNKPIPRHPTSGRARLEQQLRAKEILGQRVTYAVGFLLAGLSVAFATYAIDSRSGQASLPSILPTITGSLPVNSNKGLASAHRHRSTDPESTGSVRKNVAANTQADEARSADDAEQADSKSIARGYVVRKVVQGAALVEGPDGLQAVIPGVVLPGAGRIMKIEQQDSGWVVVTSETVIKTAPL